MIERNGRCVNCHVDQKVTFFAITRSSISSIVILMKTSNKVYANLSASYENDSRLHFHTIMIKFMNSTSTTTFKGYQNKSIYVVYYNNAFSSFTEGSCSV